MQSISRLTDDWLHCVALGCRIAQGVRNFDGRDVRIDGATEGSCRKEAQHEEDDTEKEEVPRDVCELER